jgi:hypothetical protein
MNIKQAQHHLPSTCDGLIGGRGKVFLEKTRDFQNCTPGASNHFI